MHEKFNCNFILLYNIIILFSRSIQYRSSVWRCYVHSLYRFECFVHANYLIYLYFSLLESCFYWGLFWELFFNCLVFGFNLMASVHHLSFLASWCFLGTFLFSCCCKLFSVLAFCCFSYPLYYFWIFFLLFNKIEWGA